jgi:hypothetical protein
MLTLGDLQAWLERHKARLTLETIRGDGVYLKGYRYLATVENAAREGHSADNALHKAIEQAILDFEAR